jgi:hypothetical protein
MAFLSLWWRIRFGGGLAFWIHPERPKGLPTIGNPFRFLCSTLIDHSECELNEIQAKIVVNGSQIVHQYPKLF